MLRCTHERLPERSAPIEVYQQLYERHEAARALKLSKGAGTSIGTQAVGSEHRIESVRSLGVARLLWALAPPLGLHHLYLWRDSCFVLHALTGGGFLLGWLADGAALSSYVDEANASLAATARRSPISGGSGGFIDGAGRLCAPPPSLGATRWLAMVGAGAYLSCVIGAALPSDWLPLGRAHPLFDPRWVVHAGLGALGAWLVGSTPLRACSARAAFAAAAGGSICATMHARAILAFTGPFIFAFSPRLYHLIAALLLPLAIRFAVLPAAAAAAACARTGRRAQSVLPWRQRPAGTNARRALLLGACVLGGWAATAHAARMGRLPLLTGVGGALRDVMGGDPRVAWLALRRAAAYSAGMRFPSAPGGDEPDSSDAERAAREELGLPLEGELALSNLKAAHRATALSTHPDKLPASASDDDRAEAAAQFARAQEAFELLVSRVNARSMVGAAKENAAGGGRSPHKPRESPGAREEL